MAVSGKPIAVLCTDIVSGFQYMLDTLGQNVAEYTNQHRQRARLFDIEGQEYIMIDDSVKLKGLEISDYRITPGLGKRKDAMEMVNEAKLRIR